MLSKFSGIVLLLFILLFSSFVNGKELKFATTSDSLPILLKVDESYVGIHADILSALCLDLGVDYSILPLPRKRLEQYVKSGKVQLGGFLNKGWVNSDDFYWSEQIFLLKTVFLTRKDHALKIEKIDDLKGMRVGCQLGYFYSPEMMARFSSGVIKRDDTQFLRQNYRRLELGYVDAILLTQIDAEYLFKLNPNYKVLYEIQPMLESSYEISLMCSKLIPVPMEKINASIRKMKQDGTIKDIFKKYGVTL